MRLLFHFPILKVPRTPVILAQKAVRFFSSLKLAIAILTALTLALIAGTLVESDSGIQYAQYWVYRSYWFYALLTLLGLNIFFVALSRYPWQKRHAPFLLAHMGILILLLGSFLSFLRGIDGHVTFSEGEKAQTVDLDSSMIAFLNGMELIRFKVPWHPEGYTPPEIPLGKLGWVLDRYITHSERIVSYLPVKKQESQTSRSRLPAVQLKLSGGPLPISQKQWLWLGSNETKSVPLGPALFEIHAEQSSNDKQTVRVRGPRLTVVVPEQGVPLLISHSAKGEVKRSTNGVHLPGWMGMKIEVLEYLSDATQVETYAPVSVSQRENTYPAIRISPEQDRSGARSLWFGYGDRKLVATQQGEMPAAFLPERVSLPFALLLNRFEMDFDPGTRSPASYRSIVTVRTPSGAANHVIQMNEPLSEGKYTFYQSSYIPADPRPTTSVLSVNYDPGRELKYLGSFLIVLGSILLFVTKMRRKQNG